MALVEQVRQGAGMRLRKSVKTLGVRPRPHIADELGGEARNGSALAKWNEEVSLAYGPVGAKGRFEFSESSRPIEE